MGKIAPERTRQVKLNKNILKEVAIRKLNEMVENDAGDMVSNAEEVIDRLLLTAKKAESNKDATSAAIKLFEFSVGKAAVESHEEHEEVPAVRICVSASNDRQMELLVNRPEYEEKESTDGKFLIEGDDGEHIEVDYE